MGTLQKLALLLGIIISVATFAETDIDLAKQRIADEEAVAGSFSAALPNLLTILADLQRHQGLNDQARENLRRAQHIIHRHQGVYAPAQGDVVDALNDLAVISHDLEAVTTGYAFRHEISRRHAGDYHPDTIDKLIVLANWYQAMGHYTLARDLLEKSMNELPDSLSLPNKHVAKLQNTLAVNQYLEGRCCSMSLIEGAYNNVADDPASDRVERAKALQTKANLSVMAGKRITTDTETRSDLTSTVVGVSRTDRMVRAYEAVPHDPASYFNRKPGAITGFPIPFCTASVNAMTPDGLPIRIEAEVTINDKGKARNIAILESNASGRLELLFQKVATLTRYRPPIVDGKPVATTVRFTQDFTQGTEGASFAASNLASIHACHQFAARVPTLVAPAIATVQ